MSKAYEKNKHTANFHLMRFHIDMLIPLCHALASPSCIRLISGGRPTLRMAFEDLGY